MRGMAAGPGADLGALGGFVVVWVTMMAAMMLPSVAPMALVFARVSTERARKGQAAFVATWVFLAGYFAAWTAYGIVAYLFDRAIRSLNLEFLQWNHHGAAVAGAAIVAA